MLHRVSRSHFGEVDVTTIAGMTDHELDCLPFGMLELDPKGTVVRMNRIEGEIVGYDPATVIGQSFFADVAPCTNTPEFLGRFQEGVARGELRAIFEYCHEGQRRGSVWVHMFGQGERYFILTKRIG